MSSARILLCLVSAGCARSELTQQFAPEDASGARSLDPITLCAAAEGAAHGTSWFLDVELTQSIAERTPLCEPRDAPCHEADQKRTRWVSWDAPFVRTSSGFFSPMAGVYRKDGLILVDLIGSRSWVRLFFEETGADWRSIIQTARQPLHPGATSLSASFRFDDLPVKLVTPQCEKNECVPSQVEFSQSGIAVGPSLPESFPIRPADRLARMPGTQTITPQGRFALTDETGTVLGCGRL